MSEDGAGRDWKPEYPRTMYFLDLANHAVRGRLDQALRAHQMTGLQYTVLSVIASQDGLSSAELSRRFFVTPQTMNELIAGLQRRGLIKRSSDPANRRILRMSVTPAGAALLKACDAVADEVEREVFGDLPRETYLELRRIVRGLARSLRGRDPAAAPDAKTARRSA